MFVKNVDTGAIARASTAADGTQANAFSFSPDLSADGRIVAFHSAATSLVAGDTNASTDVFVKYLDTGEIVRASTTSDGRQVSGDSSDAVLSADGRYVAFRSLSSDLVPNDRNASADIFVKDLETGYVVRASTAANGAQGFRASSFPTLSDDGLSVAFFSDADNLVPGDTNNAKDVIERLQPLTLAERCQHYLESTSACNEADKK